MSFINGIKVAEFVQNFLNIIDKDIYVNYDDEFRYDLANHTVMIGLNQFGASIEYQETVNEIHDFLLKTKGYDYTPYCSHQTFNLLHEMGHAQTMKIIPNKALKDLMVDYVYNQEIFDYAYANGEIEYEELQEFHMQETLEEFANSWAIIFIEENQEIVKQFDQIFIKGMNTIVK